MDVAVLGVGADGRKLAERVALAGEDVSFHAENVGAVMSSIDRIERRLDDAVAAGDLSREARSAAVDRLGATTELEGAVRDAAVVVDTATDKRDPQARLAGIEEAAGRDALIVTTATAGSVTAAAAGLRNPGRAVGLAIHGEPPLAEIVATEQTTAEGLGRAESFVETVADEAVVVGDAPGTAVSRLTLAVEVEAIHLVANGTAGVEAVDTAMEETRGERPLERADRAGLADRLASLETLSAALSERFQPPQLLRDRVAAGKTGVDANEGFYRWEGGDPAGSALDAPLSGDKTGLDGPERG